MKLDKKRLLRATWNARYRELSVAVHDIKSRDSVIDILTTLAEERGGFHNLSFGELRLLKLAQNYKKMTVNALSLNYFFITLHMLKIVNKELALSTRKEYLKRYDVKY